MNKASERLEALARLAREGCVYHESSQRERAAPTTLTAHKNAGANRSLKKRMTLLKHE